MSQRDKRTLADHRDPEQTTERARQDLHRPERRPSKWNVLARRVSIGRLLTSDLDSSGLSHVDSGEPTIADDHTGVVNNEEQHFAYLVRTLRSPTLGTYTNLKKTLENCSREWMLQFLGHNGLGILIKALSKLCEKNSPRVVDTFLQLGCVACVKAVMNSQTGLDCIIENQDFTRKFSSGE